MKRTNEQSCERNADEMWRDVTCAHTVAAACWRSLCARAHRRSLPPAHRNRFRRSSSSSRRRSIRTLNASLYVVLLVFLFVSPGRMWRQVLRTRCASRIEQHRYTRIRPLLSKMLVCMRIGAMLCASVAGRALCDTPAAAAGTHAHRILFDQVFRAFGLCLSAFAFRSFCVPAQCERRRASSSAAAALSRYDDRSVSFSRCIDMLY
jgi:hypothetical protein